MTCKNCKIKSVWEFTNQTKLCKKCFTDYIEKKVFKTIREFGMLPESREIVLEEKESLNSQVLKNILEKKFSVGFGKANLMNKNLSQVAEEIFENILEGRFEGSKNKNYPLYYVSDAELEIYAKLCGINGKIRKKDEKIRSLFEKFIGKNPDLEINVIRAIGQLKN